MKKFIISLILSLPFMMFVSCSSEADALEPDAALTVDNTVELSGVTLLNDTFYAIEGATIQINGISVKTVSAQYASFVSAIYMLNENVIASENVASKNRASAPSFTATSGSYKLNAALTLRRSDASLTGMSVNIPLVVVKDASQIPANAPALGTYAKTVRVRK